MPSSNTVRQPPPGPDIKAAPWRLSELLFVDNEPNGYLKDEDLVGLLSNQKE